MTTTTDLKAVETHFAFGKNWSEYAKQIDDDRIEEAKKGLLRLLTTEELKDKSFLDIGCGSGLSTLAALRLGVSPALATDIDTHSVATTKQVLARFAPHDTYEVMECSVFELPNTISDTFDVVYSWGVLHHTGDMQQAIAEASKMVVPDGLLAIALYRKTRLCGVWRRIKRWYTQASPATQGRARAVYITLLKGKYRLTGKDFAAMRDNYLSSRGMSFEHDVHDWMGGFPYESVTPDELQEIMEPLGFTLVRRNVHPSGIGFFGSGCDEFLYRNKQK